MTDVTQVQKWVLLDSEQRHLIYTRLYYIVNENVCLNVFLSPQI